MNNMNTKIVEIYITLILLVSQSIYPFHINNYEYFKILNVKSSCNINKEIKIQDRRNDFEISKSEVIKSGNKKQSINQKSNSIEIFREFNKTWSIYDTYNSTTIRLLFTLWV
jgi:hypothetical protein